MTATQVPRSGAEAMLVGLAALGVTAVNSLWQVLKYGTVMAHEGAHAAGLAMIFQKVGGIEFEPGASGGTDPDGKNLAGKTFVPRFIWFLFWLGGTLTAVAIGGKWLILGT